MAIGRIPEPGTGIPESIVDAKGDIVTATAADTPARLAVGTNEQRLVADSAAATGLKYVADTTNYAVAAKGDLLVGTAADTVAVLSVGTNGHTLVADSSVSPTGLKWAAPAGGGDFVLITAQTFSASSGVNVNSVFTSTYNNYKVIVNVTSTSTSNDFDLRLRASGTDNTSSTYQYTGVNTYSDIDTIYIQRGNSATSFQRSGNAASGDDGATNMIYEFLNPQASIRTGLTYHCISADGSRVIYDSGSGIFDNTTSFDGFSLIVDTGNITGKVYVYGYKV